ncbi:MAG: disulfide bond formation protein DsbA, partial [Micavibrio aeruginosavorus]
KQPEWAIHEAPDIERAWKIAADAGLNIDEAKQYIASANIKALLDQEISDINENNVQSTPTFFVNGEPLTSFGEQPLLETIERNIKK